MKNAIIPGSYDPVTILYGVPQRYLTALRWWYRITVKSI